MVKQNTDDVGKGMAQKIKEAAAKSNIKTQLTPEQALEQQIKDRTKDLPKNFFDKARQQADANCSRRSQKITISTIKTTA